MENSENSSSSFLPHAAKNGLILGFVSILMYVIVYVVDLSMMADWKFGVFSFVLFCGLAVYFGIGYRTEIGGFISYGDAFKYSFVMLGVSSLIGLVFQMLLFNVIDPELPQTLTRVMIENQEKMLSGFGMDPAAIDGVIEKMEKDLPANYSFVGQLKSSWAIVVASAIFAAIASIFIKKNEPEFS
jgi:hypothetical protein